VIISSDCQHHRTSLLVRICRSNLNSPFTNMLNSTQFWHDTPCWNLISASNLRKKVGVSFLMKSLISEN
jgi:hypothetical protein